VSLLLWEGKSIAYVAEQAGHDVATLSTDYAGVLHDLEGSPRVSAEEAIRQSRSDAGLRSGYARSSRRSGRLSPGLPRFAGKPSAGLEPATPSLPWRCSTD
jgi:hypothetical protein